MSSSECTWKFDNGVATWLSSCDKAVVDSLLKPEDYEFEYCPYCGNEITIERD